MVFRRSLPESFQRIVDIASVSVQVANFDLTAWMHKMACVWAMAATPALTPVLSSRLQDEANMPDHRPSALDAGATMHRSHQIGSHRIQTKVLFKSQKHLTK